MCYDVDGAVVQHLHRSLGRLEMSLNVIVKSLDEKSNYLNMTVKMLKDMEPQSMVLE